MLDNVTVIFEDMKDMMYKLGRHKKKSYENNMMEFRNKHGHYFIEMTKYVASAENKEMAATEIADCFCNQCAAQFKNEKGKVKARYQADINLFLIYYVFPAISLLLDDNGNLISDKLCEKWNETFNQKIGHADYQSIHDSFNEKLLGLF